MRRPRGSRSFQQYEFKNIFRPMWEQKWEIKDFNPTVVGFHFETEQGGGGGGTNVQNKDLLRPTTMNLV